MAFEDDLTTYLESKTALTDLLGSGASGFYPQVAPQGVATPYMIYARISGTQGHHMTAADGLQQSRYQFDAYGTYKQVKAIQDALRQAMDGFRGLFSTVRVQACHLMDIRDLYEEPDDGQQFGLHRVSMDFYIAYSEDVPTFS